MLDRRNDSGIAAHGAGHPGVVLGAAFAVSADGFGIPVLEFAHQGGQVIIQAVGIVSRHNELTGNGGIAALSAFGSLFSQQHLRAVFIGRDRRVGASAAVAQHDHIIFFVPCDGFFRFGVGSLQAHARHGQASRADCRAFQEGTAGDFLVHIKNPFLFAENRPFYTCIIKRSRLQ